MDRGPHDTMKTSPPAPSTKDILGEHLHSKVRVLLSSKSFEFASNRVCLCKSRLSDKVTGMLLEGSEIVIRKMLENDHFLSEKVHLAIQCLNDHLSEDANLEVEKTQFPESVLSCEELGDLLFEKVSCLESKYAAQITGMLLELDPRTLRTLLQDENHLLEATVNKARNSLEAYQNKEGSKKGVDMDKSSLVKSNTLMEGSGSLTLNGEGMEEPLDKMGMQIYKMALCLHPEAASQITGMILEMEAGCLSSVVKEPSLLQLAIEKAFTVWKLAS